MAVNYTELLHLLVMARAEIDSSIYKLSSGMEIQRNPPTRQAATPQNPDPITPEQAIDIGKGIFNEGLVHAAGACEHLRRAGTIIPGYKPKNDAKAEEPKPKLELAGTRASKLADVAGSGHDPDQDGGRGAGSTHGG